jgi:hypothetical protein
MSILGNGAPQKRHRKALRGTFAAHSLQIPVIKKLSTGAQVSPDWGRLNAT